MQQSALQTKNYLRNPSFYTEILMVLMHALKKKADKLKLFEENKI